MSDKNQYNETKERAKMSVGTAALGAANLIAHNALNRGELTGRRTGYVGTVGSQVQRNFQQGIPAKQIEIMGVHSDKGRAYSQALRTVFSTVFKHNPRLAVQGLPHESIKPYIVEVNVPLWKTDPRKDGISAEYIKGTKSYKPNSLAEISQYIKARPRDFLKGVGRLGAGAALGTLGAGLMYDASKNIHRGYLNMKKQANKIDNAPGNMLSEVIETAGPGFGALGAYTGAKILHNTVHGGALTGRRTMYAQNRPGGGVVLFDSPKDVAAAAGAQGNLKARKVNVPLWRNLTRGADVEVPLSARSLEARKGFADAYTPGNKGYKGNSVGEVFAYAKRNPKAFLKALGRAGIGAGLLGGGLYAARGVLDGVGE